EPVVVAEPAVRCVHREEGSRREYAQCHEADQGGGHAAPARGRRTGAGGRCGRARGGLGDHPAIWTVSWPPQKIRDSSRLRRTTATIEARMALPLATPTPAGPPLAL